MTTKPLRSLRTLAALTALGLGALWLGGCGGQVADPDANLQVSDADTASAALGSPDPGADEGDADDDDDGEHEKGGHGEKGDHKKGGKGCHGGDHKNHEHHRHHKFKVLDRIDGAKDGIITIAALPSALPERLLARLHAIDANGDGLVTKDEVKAWFHAHDHGG